MKHKFVISVILLLLTVQCRSQIDREHRYYPLPPGPERFSGSITYYGKPLQNALIKLTYTHDQKEVKRDFTTGDHGQYTVYFPRSSKNITMAVIHEDSVLHIHEMKDANSRPVPRYDLTIDESGVRRKAYKFNR